MQEMKPELWESFGGVRGVSERFGTRKGMKRRERGEDRNSSGSD
jgi:hypothetical protein